jgi:hypothetical protein
LVLGSALVEVLFVHVTVFAVVLVIGTNITINTNTVGTIGFIAKEKLTFTNWSKTFCILGKIWF